MPKQIDPLPENYEAHGIAFHTDGRRVMLAIETDRGPVAVHMLWTTFSPFAQQAKRTLERLPPTRQWR